MPRLLRSARLMVCAGLLAGTLGMAGCASSHRASSHTQYERDRQLAERVYSALQSSPVYKYPNLTVHAYKGRVQLSGFVATEAQRIAARDIAADVSGVARVDNDLQLARP